jgi:hypothetical protein
MFQIFEYIESIVSDISEIKNIYRVSSIIQLEEMLSNLRDNPSCCVLVRDSGDGTLNFKDKRLDTAYHTFYVMARARVNDNAARLAAKRLAMFAGIRLMDRMRADSEDFGSDTYGLNDSRVEYNEFGPVGQGYWGYSFSFTIEQGFVKYSPYPPATYITGPDEALIVDEDDNHIIF